MHMTAVAIDCLRTAYGQTFVVMITDHPAAQLGRVITKNAVLNVKVACRNRITNAFKFVRLEKNAFQKIYLQ